MPCGVGVNKRATEATSSAASALKVLVGASYFVPTLKTTDPSLSIDAVIKPGEPAQEKTTSADLTAFAKVIARVCECTTVTVASLLIKALARGKPSLADRPTTTTSAPPARIEEGADDASSSKRPHHFREAFELSKSKASRACNTPSTVKGLVGPPSSASTSFDTSKTPCNIVAVTSYEHPTKGLSSKTPSLRASFEARFTASMTAEADEPAGREA
mmetsp:Transcript_19078/g.64438  ORF Transcript_19078/g.64438 Transcript_19078/m.64438 type:complete len:216 (+) Transcript_19078:1769-2416(+)